MARAGRGRPAFRERTCVGCRTRRSKDALIRVVGTASGVEPDLRQALPGRGAYVCPSEACVQRASRHLARALRLVGPVDTSPGRLWSLLRPLTPGAAAETTPVEPPQR